MTRVVHLLGETGCGGAENQCLYLLHGLRTRALDLEIAYLRAGSEHRRFAALDLPMHQVASRGRMPYDWAMRARSLHKLLATDPPGILHTWLFEAHEVGLMAALPWRNTRIVLAHRSGPGIPGTGKHLLALRPFMTRIDHVVANSPSGRDMMVRFGLPPERVSVISNGVPADRVAVSRARPDLRHDLAIPQEAPLVCMVSRPDPCKDFGTLFTAFHHLRARRREARLILVGSTTGEIAALGHPLPAGAQALGFSRSPADFMCAADVVVVSSRSEGHSNAADEALLLGKPVATTDVGGHVPLVRAAGGRVVAAGRGDLLGAAIVDLLDHPPEKGRVLKAATVHLSMTRVVNDTAELYARLLAGDLRRRKLTSRPTQVFVGAPSVFERFGSGSRRNTN